jgi:cellobiose-specific phosphotransferase system component IIC
MYRALAVCCAIVLSFDVAASFASELTRIEYGWFSILQIAMYLAIGYYLFRSFGMDRRFFIILGVAAICEATIGWWLSALIGPGKPRYTETTLLVSGILFAVVFNTIVGILGGWAAKFLMSRRT